MSMEVHLVDGTYELFRHHFAVPSHITDEGIEVAAVRGALTSMMSLLEQNVTHVGIATDRVVESFRNDLFDGYKTGEGTPPELFSQFPLLDAALDAAGFVVFSMEKHEADDALGAAAVKAASDPRVTKVLICTPDKDLAQVVNDQNKIVQFDRRKEIIYDEKAIKQKFGVPPESIPDYLALVGDTADGIPGLPGWGAKSSSTILACYKHLENVPPNHEEWEVIPRGANKLSSTFTNQFEEALLYRQLATLDFNAPVMKNVDELLWTGPKSHFLDMCEHLDAQKIFEKAELIATSRN
ncbi:MAG TPA: 5'-3' exonuclease H3TH domain-containing protein [Acidimicrobiales bacterium]|nr:5'-3' exonuclease H3TH domain-containing protein [Acidimicrobiales bacterium]|tara:strand:- start:4133 stop:5020 length:888 start_codon:yes stop_codon:yes gene_type:complete